MWKFMREKGDYFVKNTNFASLFCDNYVIILAE